LDDVAVAVEQVAELDSPIAMAVRAGSDDLYVAERPGRVRIVRDDGVVEQPVIDIADRVSTGGERGLLGLDFTPDGERLILSYTDPNGDSRVESFPMDGDRADAQAGQTLLEVGQPYANHNGGNVVVGPDDKLYIGLGDGGSAGDPQNNGQDSQTLLGSLLRVELDGTVPDDNPFVDGGGQPEIFAIGLRNPWRFSFDRETDQLWVADVGQSAIEEINVTNLEQTAGRNYGWNLMEGTQTFAGDGHPDDAVVPVVEYPTGEQGCAVTGGYVYRGEAIDDLRGAYLYSDFCGGWLRAVRMNGRDVGDEATLGVELPEVASFGQDADGELYLLSLAGGVYRIVPD